MMKIIKLAIIRQNYRLDGGAERIIQRILADLTTQATLTTTLITQSWEGTNKPENLMAITPKGWTRAQRFDSFQQQVQAVLAQQSFDIVQSHERIVGCQIYRAGDGVHAEWLQIRAKQQLGWLGRWWQQRDAFHQAVLKAEYALLTHPDLQAVICNSEMVQKEILQHYPQCDAKKLYLIRNGLDLDHFTLTTEEQRKKARTQLKINKKRPVALFVGSGFARKGVQNALLAMVRLPDWDFLVVGQDKQLAQYRAVCKHWGMSHRVHFVGAQKDVRPYYQAADVLLHPAWYDPAPNVVLEAMAMGLPVITSTKCGNQELITAGENGFVLPAGDAKQLAKLLREGKKSDCWQQMGKNARQVAEGYPISKMTAELVALYQKLMAK